MIKSKVLLLGLFAIAFIGCNRKVPTGHVGRVQTVSGFNDEVLAPGLHNCYGRDTLFTIEVSDRRFAHHMEVLCQDQLNFRFDISILCAVNRKQTDLIRNAFENVTPLEGTTITAQQLYDMYIKSVVDQEARKIVANYTTKEIAVNRQQVISEIQQAVLETSDNSLMVVKRVTVNNLDFPEVITKAQEQRAKREVEIASARAEAQMRVERAKGDLQAAQIEYERELIEAAMIADANKIIGSSITPQYLGWWQLKVLSDAASGPNNWGFIPYTDLVNSNLGQGNEDWGAMTIDEELRTRIREARQKAASENGDSPEPRQTQPPESE